MIRAGKLLTSTGDKAAMVDLGEALNGMFRAFRVRGDAVAAMNAYLTDLADLDVDDVIKAVGRFSRQVVPAHDYRFEPSPVQIRAEIRRVNEMFRSPDRPPQREALPAPEIRPRTEAEKERADAILKAAGYGPKGDRSAAEPESDEERKRRAAQMERDAKARAENHARIAQEWADLGEEPMYADDARTMIASPALAAILRAQA